MKRKSPSVPHVVGIREDQWFTFLPYNLWIRVIRPFLNPEKPEDEEQLIETEKDTVDANRVGDEVAVVLDLYHQSTQAKDKKDSDQEKKRKERNPANFSLSLEVAAVYLFHYFKEFEDDQTGILQMKQKLGEYQITKILAECFWRGWKSLWEKLLCIWKPELTQQEWLSSMFTSDLINWEEIAALRTNNSWSRSIAWNGLVLYCQDKININKKRKKNYQKQGDQNQNQNIVLPCEAVCCVFMMECAQAKSGLRIRKMLFSDFLNFTMIPNPKIFLLGKGIEAACKSGNYSGVLCLHEILQKLQKSPATAECQEKFVKQSFMLSIRHDHELIVKFFLENNKFYRISNQVCVSGFYEACSTNKIKMMKILVSKMSEQQKSVKIPENKAQFLLSIRNNHLEVTEFLWIHFHFQDSWKLCFQNNLPNELLTNACRLDHVEAFQFVYENMVGQKDKQKDFILRQCYFWYACSWKGQPRMVQFLLENFPVSKLFVEDELPQLLNRIAQSGNVSVMQMLKQKVTLSAHNIRIDEYTPLISACAFANLDMLQYFIEEFKLAKEEVRRVLEPPEIQVKYLRSPEIVDFLVTSVQLVPITPKNDECE